MACLDPWEEGFCDGELTEMPEFASALPYAHIKIGGLTSRGGSDETLTAGIQKSLRGVAVGCALPYLLLATRRDSPSKVALASDQRRPNSLWPGKTYLLRLK